MDTEDKRIAGMEITRSGRRKWWVWVFVALLAGLGVYAVWIFLSGGTRARGQGPVFQPKIPVVAIAANTGRYPHIYYRTGNSHRALYRHRTHPG